MTIRVLTPLALVISLAMAQSSPIFDEVAADTGLAFTYQNGAAGQLYIPEVMGAGAALIDHDGDGDLDVVLLQGHPLSPQAKPHGLHRIYRNQLVPSGHLRFVDATAGSGLGGASYGMGIATGDYDGDGDEDIYITAFGANTLYRNNGDGTFADVTASAGVNDDRWSTAAAFLDYDRDGDLDLFVVNYLDFTLAANKQCFDPAGTPDYCGPRQYRPVPDRLFRNDGGGRFTDVSESSGITGAFGGGLGIGVGDYNVDGWLDVYVANDAMANQLWINQKDGTFVDDGPLSGAGLNAAGNPEGSMGVARGDYDRDGDEDLFITNIIAETFAFYVNDGAGGFEDRRVAADLARPTASSTGFGTDFLDYDNDGWLDLFVTNGAVNIVESQRGEPVPYKMPNQLFRNLGTGRFAEVSAQAGSAFQRPEVGRAAALGDIDNDGDTDVLVTNNIGPARLWRNEVGSRKGWLQVRLDAPGGNPRGYGSRIQVSGKGLTPLVRRVGTSGSYLAAGDPVAHFGLGDHEGPVVVRVEWLGGPVEEWTIEKVRQRVTLKRGTGKPGVP
jgi:hypothetical protein